MAVIRCAALVVLAASVLAGGAQAADGSVKLAVVDMLGRSMPVVAVLSTPDGAEVARSAAPGEAAAAAPGHYDLAPAEAAELRQPVELADGAALDKVIQAPESIWLSFAMGDKVPPYWLLFKPKPQEALAALLPRLRFGSWGDSKRALARPDASPEARAAARDLALAQFAKPPLASTASDQERNFAQAAYRWAARILDAIGEEPDGAKLASLAVADIDARLGVLAHGSLIDRLTVANQAASAAMALHEMGSDAGDAVLLESASDPKSVFVFPDLLDFPPDTVRDAMAAVARRYGERAAAITASGEDTYNEFSPARMPAILYFLAYGPGEALKPLIDAPLHVNGAQILAVAADDPMQLADYVVAQSRFSTTTSEDALSSAALFDIAPDLAAFCPAADTLPADAADRFWDRLYQFVYDRALARRKAVVDESVIMPPAFAANVSGRLMAYAGPCVTSHWAIGAYMAQNCEQEACKYWGWLPLVDWIPHYWWGDKLADALTAGNVNNPYLEDQSELMPPDGLDKVLDAKGAPGAAPPLDLLRAYHRVATRAGAVFTGYPVRLASDAERRSYLIGGPQQAAGYDVALSGIATLSPELVDGRLRLHLRLDQMSGFAAHNMYDDYSGGYDLGGGQKYLIDRGRALVQSVRLWRGDKPLEVAARGLDRDGALLYEAEVGDAGLDGLIAEVDLAVFDDKRALVYALYRGDYAAHLRRAALAVARAKASAAASPEAADPLVELARAEADAGRIAAALGDYRQALARDAGNGALWLEAAGLERRVADPAGASGLLGDAVQANPDNLDLLSSLADSLFQGGDYAASAVRYADLVKAQPDESAWRVRQGAMLWLAGDFAGAASVFAALPDEARSRVVGMLDLTAAAAGPEDAKAAALARYTAFYQQEKGKADEAMVGVLIGQAAPDAVLTPVLNKPSTTGDAQCQAELWVGESFALQGKVADARTHLSAALGVCTVKQVYYHAARQALARLPAS